MCLGITICVTTTFLLYFIEVLICNRLEIYKKKKKTHQGLRSSDIEEGVTNHVWVNHGRLPKGSDPELGFGN